MRPYTPRPRCDYGVRKRSFRLMLKLPLQHSKHVRARLTPLPRCGRGAGGEGGKSTSVLTQRTQVLYPYQPPRAGVVRVGAARRDRQSRHGGLALRYRHMPVSRYSTATDAGRRCLADCRTPYCFAARLSRCAHGHRFRSFCY